MHNTQMTTTAILGCAGYVGQETLDRVLAHPELEPVALGSGSLARGALSGLHNRDPRARASLALAGESASALGLRLDGGGPRFVSNREALAAGAELVFLCLG